MDPDAALAAILDDARRVVDAPASTIDAGYVELAEYVLGLHHWLAAGGFLPAAWHQSICTAHSCR